MRRGASVKAAVATTLKKVFVAANTGINLKRLTVEFTGNNAYVTTTKELVNGVTCLAVNVVMPDICDTAVLQDEDANRVVAIALHELGHAFFTETHVWDDHLNKNFHLKSLHRAINCFEDPREERALIDSGYAPGSALLFKALLEWMMRDAGPESFLDPENVAFAIAVEGRGYLPSILHMIPEKWREIVKEGAERCKHQQSTMDACINGLWLARKMEEQESQPENKGKGQGKGEEQGEGEGQGEAEQGEGQGKGRAAGKGKGASRKFDIEPSCGDLPLSEMSSIASLQYCGAGSWETA